ncbi:MAG TPA: D-sedoheptulose 7-phosphate isomerase [Chloroflexota bacterium]|nr:D-sedoheptulose 7-phosphate isomerase [Chloroflexota bacterium]
MSVEETLRRRARAHLLAGSDVRRLVADQCADQILEAARVVADCFRAGGKLLICGNGGSAADSQHMAAEFVSRLSADFERPALPAIALTTDSSFLTAYANDYGFEGIFSRQVEALGKAGDVLVGISTSGNSANVIRAMEAASSQGMRTIALVGNGGRMAGLADVALVVPSRNTQQVQETHLALEHLVCDLAERFLYGVSGQKKGTLPRRIAS